MLLADAAELIEKIGGTLVTLAEVPLPKRTQFLREVGRMLSLWATRVIRCAGLPSGDADADRLLYQILHSADALHKQLSEIVDAVRAAHRWEAAAVIPFFAGFKLDEALIAEGEMEVADVLSMVSFLRRAIGIALEDSQVLPTGALPGNPLLDELVLGLACAARRAGGRFTAHRTHGEKGSLVKALNEIKNCLANQHFDFSEELADVLPAPDQHPVATYERLLMRSAQPSRRMRSHSAG